MKERPILFSGPMVRALLAGSKTQTRRIAKIDDVAYGKPVRWVSVASATTGLQDVACPYGQPGDRLWVRETFYAWGRWETRYSPKKGRDEWHFVDMTLECGKAYEYPATGGQPQPMGGKRQRGGTTPAWWKRPTIHMPRRASRITLEITSVRVERLQEISEADAVAEGIERKDAAWWRNYISDSDADAYTHLKEARASFSSLWVSINGAGSWDSNPWVWVVEFKRVEQQR